MIYCKICLDPSTRPRIEFNSNGVCFACSNFINEKKNYNENNRLRILSEIVEKFKNKSDKKNYDCILGISGGKDSTRQALWLRDKLNVNPLLVCCSYPPEQITDVGAKNKKKRLSVNNSFKKGKAFNKNHEYIFFGKGM